MNKSQTRLQLGDFVYPRYVPVTSLNEQANVYRVIEIQKGEIILAQNVFNSVERISASEDFFIKLEQPTLTVYL